MDAKATADENGAKRKLSFNLNSSKLPGNDGADGGGGSGSSNDATERSFIRSPSPTQLTDDFLNIVPKPTLLSKENAKRRLQAFSLAKYQSSKKPKLTTTPNVGVEVVPRKPPGSVTPKRKSAANHVDVARETVEEIEKYKHEEEVFMLEAKHETEKYNYNDRKRQRRSQNRDIRRRSRPPARPQEVRNERRPSSAAHDDRERERERRRSESHPRERKSWSDYEDDFAKFPENNELPATLVDLRRMLLFTSPSNSIRAYQYKKADGTAATIPSQYLRYTSKSSPRIVYCPNQKHLVADFIQREESFSVILKPQKECLMNLINQATQAKPISPHKPATTRHWYPSDYLLERPGRDESPASSSPHQNDVKTKRKRGDKSKKAKKKQERKERRRRRRKEHKESRSKADDDRRSKATHSRSPSLDLDAATTTTTTTTYKRKRTDSHKSDISKGSTDKHALNNHLPAQSSPRSATLPNSKPSDSATKTKEKISTPPSSPPPPLAANTSSPVTPKSSSKLHSKTGDVDKPSDAGKAASKVESNKKPDSVAKDKALSGSARLVLLRHSFPGKSEESESSLRARHNSDSDFKYNSMAVGPTLSMLARRIYKIGSDSVSAAVPTVEPVASAPPPSEPSPKKSPPPAEPQVDAPKSVEKPPTKDVIIEKLKTKPSELYSPTLQSSTSVTSDTDPEMPNTNEYRSHWESEEELNSSLMKEMNNSWESEDESYPVIVERTVDKKPKEITERSLEMPLNITISRPRASLGITKSSSGTPKLEKKASMLFEDLDGTNSWDADVKPVAVYDTKTDADGSYDTLPMIDKPNLEDEYVQFMSSVSTMDDDGERKRRYSSSSSSTSSSSSSSSSESSSSTNDDAKGKSGTKRKSKASSKSSDGKDEQTLDSPLCKVDSTSSPATLPLDENSKVDLARKPLPAITLPKKNPLLGCSLFKDEDSDPDMAHPNMASDNDSHRYDSRDSRHSPHRKRSEVSPRRGSKLSSSPRRPHSPPVRRYSPKRDRRIRSPRRRDSPVNRKDLSPRPRDLSPRRSSLTPRRGMSPKPRELRDMSPRRPLRDLERKGSRSPPRFHDTSPRRRSPKHRDGSRSPPRYRSPKHRERSPRTSIDTPRARAYDRDRHRGEPEPPRFRERERDRKYRDGSPRYRDSPPRYSSPSRRRSPPRHRYSPRFRDRSPRRRSSSPSRRVYSRSRSKERKHESITQALQRLAGMDYEAGKSPPPPINSPLEGYIRGVPDSTISDEQLLQNRMSGVGSIASAPPPGDYTSTHSPVFFHHQPPYKLLAGEGGSGGAPGTSPKRIPLDDRINQVLGIDAPKASPYPPEGQYYNQLYYDQYASINLPPVPPPNHTPHTPYEHSTRAFNKHYNRQLVDVPKVVQVGNVLQVVPVPTSTPTPADAASGSKKKTESSSKSPSAAAAVAADGAAQKFVPVGNMLQIVPTTELPARVEAATPVAPPVVVVAEEVVEDSKKKLAEDIQQLKDAERKADRDKRRQERDRRRKDKELKRKDREKRRILKLKMRSEEMIKKALNFDLNDEVEEDDTKLPSVSIFSTPTKVSKGILVVHNKNQLPDIEAKLLKPKKGVKFADGVLPGEGTSPSAGEELSSPPPFTKLPKEKRFTKTKNPKKSKHLKKKLKARTNRKAKKRGEDDDDHLPPPSPPPGSPPVHIFPPRVKMPLFNPTFYPGYPYNAMSCRPLAEPSHHPPAFPNLPTVQFPMAHLPPAAALHPIQLPPPPHLHVPPRPPPHKVHKP